MSISHNNPYYFRLSRITNFFLKGWTIAQVGSWIGSLKALDYYVGMVDVRKMGRSMLPEKNLDNEVPWHMFVL